MLSYLHAYHAGNYADVHKHVALHLCLSLLHKKASALTCFDTHGGRASYDLDSEPARRTGEAGSGVLALWEARHALTAGPWPDFWGLVESHNLSAGADGQQLRYYPGSPAWMEAMARAQDQQFVFELHPGEQKALDEWAQGRRLRILHEDGFDGLTRRLPPRTPRLLVLIDPAYELKGDYRQVPQTLEKAWRRCRHGVYLVWYPVLDAGWHGEMLERVRKTSLRKVLHCQLLPDRQTRPQRMAGSGLMVVNPPWQFAGLFDRMMAEALAVWTFAGQHRVEWLIPE